MILLKRVFIILMLTLSGFVFASQNREKTLSTNDDNFLTFTDSQDRIIRLVHEPKRIISLAPSITETIFALDSEQKLIGRTEYCDFPTSVNTIPSVGTLYEPNIEKIVELNPDLIIASTLFKQDILSKLEELSLNVIIIDENDTINGVYNNINKLGEILNRKNEASIVNNRIKKQILELKEKVNGLDRPSVYYVISYGEYGDYTAGGDTFISELIEAAGGENIAKDSMGWSYSLEKIIEKNPDLIICSKYFNTKDGLINSTGYKDLPSVLNGNVFTIDNNLVDRQGPRIAEALEALIEIIHKGNL